MWQNWIEFKLPIEFYWSICDTGKSIREKSNHCTRIKNCHARFYCPSRMKKHWSRKRLMKQNVEKWIFTVEEEKLLRGKKIAREISFRISLGILVFWAECILAGILSSSGCLRSLESGKMAQQWEQQLRQLLEEVRVLSEQISQTTRSNVNSESFRVFGCPHGRQCNPSWSVNHASSVRFSHLRRMTNMWRIGSFKGKSRSRSQLHSCVIWYYLLAQQSMLYRG